MKHWHGAAHDLWPIPSAARSFANTADNITLARFPHRTLDTIRYTLGGDPVRDGVAKTKALSTLRDAALCNRWLANDKRLMFLRMANDCVGTT
jgi:hypothetical protein